MQFAVMFVTLDRYKLTFFGTPIATLPYAASHALCLGVHYTDIVIIISIKRALPRKDYYCFDFSLIVRLILPVLLEKPRYRSLLVITIVLFQF